MGLNSTDVHLRHSAEACDSNATGSVRNFFTDSAALTKMMQEKFLAMQAKQMQH